MNTDSPVSIELDWADDLEVRTVDTVTASVIEWLGEVLPDYVTVEVITLRGEGGGWPIVRITGQPHDIRSILESYEEETG